ncbi:hypothetical protein O181_130497 [Austropuccinia psidii MF-1]|uniref:Uncharacterized protein n=1 Tax=Austropuccinia psidii MF-1 TaxID=1389203 RepID=A0A9Q3QCJ2_9BASI|nr:hypothetical protein [Austropuccinia psidii MF-1]
MTTRRGSQYSIQLDGAGLKGRIDPSKGKRMGKIPSDTESTQGSALSQRQVPEMPMICELELELSMSDANRYKSHLEGSDRHLNEPVKTVLHSLEGQGLRNVATTTLRSDQRPEHPQKIKEYHANKREETKEKSPVASTSKPQANPLPQEGKKNKKKNWRKPYSSSYIISKIQKDAVDNVFNMAQNLMELKDKEEQRMRQPHLPKK